MTTTDDRGGRENPNQCASAPPSRKPKPYWTIVAVGKNADHVSGFMLRQKEKGRNHLELEFQRDPEKAMCFGDQRAVDSMLTVFRMFAPGFMSHYTPMKHSPKATP